MAIDKYIPRIEWNDIVTSSTVAGAPTPTLTGIPSTASIRVGMLVTRTGVPAGTTVIAKTLTTVTLSADATIDGTATTTFFERYDFQYPPVKDTEDKLKAQNRVTESLKGRRQIQSDFIEVLRDLAFGFVTTADRDFLRDVFFKPWAAIGEEFRYYPDKADAAFETVALEKYDFETPRQAKKHPMFLYGFSMTTRRVIV